MGRTLTCEALLLDTVDLHDGDRIVTFLTSEYGKKRGVARGAKRKYSRFAGQLQPLAKVNIGWFEKEGRELVRISTVELLRAGSKLQEDLEGILLTAYLADHMVEFAQENEESEYLYRLLDSTLEALLAGVEPSLAARYFEAWVLRLAGIFPPPHECPLCGHPFNLQGGREQGRQGGGGRAAVLPPNGDALLCAECAGEGGILPRRSLVLAPESLDFLRQIGRRRLVDLAQGPPWTVATLGQVERLCGELRRPFLGRELKSYAMMKETLGRLASR